MILRCVPQMRADAHLSSLAIEHGLILCSTDGDFGRFRNLPGKIRFQLKPQNGLTFAT